MNGLVSYRGAIVRFAFNYILSERMLEKISHVLEKYPTSGYHYLHNHCKSGVPRILSF